MNPPPSPLTEAAGLLQSGAIFTRRVGLRPSDDPGADPTILAGFKRGACSIYLGDEPIFHFDLEGRWQRAFITGTHYLKSLDATVRAVERVREAGQMVLRRRTLGSSETAALDAGIAAQVHRIAAAIKAGSLVALPPPAPSRPLELTELAAFLGKAVGWDAGRWGDHAAAYHRAYGGGPPPFLPPDCPNPVILQPTAAMAPAAVFDHARAVAVLLGARLNQCRDVFVAGSGWVDRPAAEVVASLAAVRAVFPIEPDQGRPRGAAGVADAPRLETIHAWLDAVPEPPLAPSTWAECRAAHLGRVTLRVDLRADSAIGAIRGLVADLKGAGIGVGLACFLDPSAPPSPQAEALAALPLGPGDLITLIATEPAGTAPPPGDSIPPALATWKARIAAALPPGGPRLVVYNPAKQWA